MKSAAENAIKCFESATNLTVVVHDIAHGFWRELPASRFYHHQPPCVAVKQNFKYQCQHFAIDEFRNQVKLWADGRLHRCHAGYVELAQPIFDGDNLLLVLFAGPARAADSVEVDFTAPPCMQRYDFDVELPLLGETEIPFCRELLRQLGSRLRCLLIDQTEAMPPGQLSRRSVILEFLRCRYADAITLADLAKEMHLSVDRTRHVVLQECGQKYTSLLRDIRLQAACGLLLNTSLSVGEVACRCGMSDPAFFSRAFRRAYNTTPGQWRKRRG